MDIHPFNVLLLDDSMMITDRLRILLSDYDFITSIDSAGNHADVITLLKSKYYSAIVIDINLKNETGLTLLKELQTNSPGCKAIMFTNQVNSYYRNFCSTYGCYAFLDKSKDFEKLPLVLREIYASG